ncbi:MULTISPECIES: hypothetical protein [Butyricimonas]|uniref:Uncharacterized protein n=1 Tax=Butyricimonas hominis TaxID=2763032 RepID=A0ABR7D0I9_9BACT|nr:hypothetical protein [Butyricimonas hominis]MBC5621446.1 hypothetical protein [Butyricimonas hominis]
MNINPSVSVEIGGRKTGTRGATPLYPRCPSVFPALAGGRVTFATRR